MTGFVKYVNDIGNWIVAEKATNEGPDAAGNITEDSFDFFVEIGRMVNKRFEAEAHHYFVNEQQFKQWIIDLYQTFIESERKTNASARSDEPVEK